MMEAMIPSQVGMSLWTLQKIKEAKEAHKKKSPKKPTKKRQKPEKNIKIKNERKKRRDNVTILLPHLCFRVAPCSSYRESLELSLSCTTGNFHYRAWLVYSNDGLLQMP